MSLPLYPDGCIIPNIPVKHFVVYLAPKCEHSKLRGAYIAIDAPDKEDALLYASRWIIGSLVVREAIEVTEVPNLAAIESAV
jgi:hypothetical protein